MKEYIIEAYTESNTGSAAMGRTVAELIRCKDCKYYTGYECQRTKVSNIRVITNEGDYCSMAERKPPQVNPEMVKALKDRIEKQRGEDGKTD